MRTIVFDTETSDIFQEVGSNDPAALNLTVVCIYDSLENRYDSFFQNDLKRLWPILEKTDLLVGYNSDHFDIPLLNKYYPGDLTKIKSLDILKEIRKVLGRRIKLDTVAEATLGQKKSGHGLEATRWWREGKFEKVRDYCLDDVRITKAVYDYAREKKHLKYKDGKEIKEIPLDVSGWEGGGGAALTHTLPF